MIMEILTWLVLGGIAGWIASMLTGADARMGIGANIVVGILGAILGGFVVGLLGQSGVTGFNIYSLIVAIIGAVILLAIVNMFAGQKDHHIQV